VLSIGVDGLVVEVLGTEAVSELPSEFDEQRLLGLVARTGHECEREFLDRVDQ